MKISSVICASLLSMACFCDKIAFAQWTSSDVWIRNGNASSASSSMGADAIINEYGQPLPPTELNGGTFDYIYAKTWRTSFPVMYATPTGNASISGTLKSIFSWNGSNASGAFSVKGFWNIKATTTHGVMNGAIASCGQTNPTEPGLIPTSQIEATYSTHPNPVAGSSDIKIVPNLLSWNIITFYFDLGASASGTSSSSWASEARASANAVLSD